MSFFSAGLSGMMNKRRGKQGKKAAKKDDKKKSSDKKKDEGKWEMFTDAYGRPYWKHSKTGEWSYGGVGGSLVSPVTTINPSPIGYPGTVFTPSPVFAVAPPAKKEKKKDDDKKKGKGWWESMYDDDGDRYWEHTVTKKTTYKDPYF
eukprot:g8562.t1